MASHRPQKIRANTEDVSIPSIRKLAKLLSRDESTIRDWLKDDRWTFSRSAPWPKDQLPAMQQWRSATLEQQDDDATMEGLSAERQAKLELVIERRTKLQIERELLQGRYLLKSEALDEFGKLASEAKATLQAIISLAPRIVGKPEDEVRALLSAHVDLVCNLLAKGNQH